MENNWKWYEQQNPQQNAQQSEQLERLRSARGEEVLTLPRLATPRLAPEHLVVLADALVELGALGEKVPA